MSIKDELNYIAKRNNGCVNPEKVLKYAKNPKTALHKKFEWDNKKASHEYRLWQARQVIRVHVSIIEVDNKVIKVRDFVSLYDDRGKIGYRLTQDVLNDDQRKRQLLSQARTEFSLMRNRYEMLTILSKHFDNIEKDLEKEENKLKRKEMIPAASG